MRGRFPLADRWRTIAAMGSKPAKPVAKATTAPRARTTKPDVRPEPPSGAKRVEGRIPDDGRIADLEAAVAALTQRVAALEGVRSHGANGSGTRTGDEAIRAAVLAAVGELDLRHRYGGLVPIPDVRAELRRTGVATDDAAVTAALEALERAWKIDLSVAQSPTQVPDRGAGIERPGRGLLYYVARR